MSTSISKSNNISASEAEILKDLGLESHGMDQFSAHLDRGWDLISQGDISGALLSANKSLELDSQSPEAHNLMGYVQAASGNHESAIDHYKQAVDLDETFVEAMLNAAEIMTHSFRDFSAALELVEDALGVAKEIDELADAMLLKIDVLLQSEQPSEAKRIADRLPQGPFDNPELKFLIARARFNTGDCEGAELWIRQAAQEYPNHAEVLYYLGLVENNLHHQAQATLAFLQCRDAELHSAPPPWALDRQSFETVVHDALGALQNQASDALKDALVVVSDLPGAERVANGIDPRQELWLDGVSAEQQTISRLFIYQRNLERKSMNPQELTLHLQQLIQHSVRVALKASDTEL